MHCPIGEITISTLRERGLTTVEMMISREKNDDTNTKKRGNDGINTAGEGEEGVTVSTALYIVCMQEEERRRVLFLFV
jgi:hypothetical protein